MTDHLQVSPTTALIDDVLDIQVVGLVPGEPITLFAELKDSKMVFESCAHYVASVDGDVTCHRDESMDGSYTGVEPMGLFWSMTQAPGQPPGLRLTKKDVTTPYVTTLQAYRGHLSCEECRQGEAFSSQVVRRSYLAEGVQRIPINEGRIEATLFIPKGPGPHPGVVDLFGTVGGLVEHRAALLASRGIAAIALAYYWPEDRGITQDIEYFQEASQILMSHPRVYSDGCGVIGVSKGFDLAMFMGALVPKIRAVIGINGYPYAIATDHTYQGEKFEMSQLDGENCIPTDEGLRCFGIYDCYSEDIVIPVERTAEARFLLLHCADDQCAPMTSSWVIPARLRAHGRQDLCEVVIYPGAGHLLEPPHTPCFRSTFHKMFGCLVLWGGNPKDHAHAQEASWVKILDFFHRNIKRNPSTEVQEEHEKDRHIAIQPMSSASETDQSIACLLKSKL